MTRSQELLAAAATTSFRLNGQFLALAESLARPVGLTAAWWQVLGAVLAEPRPVATIAREMGMSRQGVQRVADLLVADDLAAYEDNPHHRRAKLVVPTAEGRAALRLISPRHRAAADRLVAELGERRLAQITTALQDLTTALDRLDL